MDLTLRRGEIQALVGENGAGKSTLIKILAGVYRKDAGEILFEGARWSCTAPTTPCSAASRWCSRSST